MISMCELPIDGSKRVGQKVSEQNVPSKDAVSLIAQVQREHVFSRSTGA
jgi:hypothetical protein